MTNYREILRLNSLGLNKTQIAEACCCSRTTVITVLRQAETGGVTYPLPESISDKELAEKLYPSVPDKPTYKMPDYEYVHKELQHSGVTLKLLWLEYCEKCRETGELPYQSTQFNKYYSDYVVKNNATMHLNHKPGEIMRILQCDNLKTGVITHGKSEIVLNKAYNEMAEHYGTAILPCRVRAPKDKAMVEGTVGVISNFILGALRNRRFLSLNELNIAIFERLETLNHTPFQKREGSRSSEFETERPFLMHLPTRPFELSEWKIATVAPNYHISVDKQNYSVPYEYIKQKVDVRITKSTIEVFFGGNRICSHPRLYGRLNQYSTVEAHMPQNHQQYVQWNGERFCKWASKIGPNTKTVVSAILGGYKVEQQGYKACMGILKLADKYSSERLESACRKALSFTPRPSLKNIQAILSSGQDKAEDIPDEDKSSSSQYGFTRGAEYYAGRKD